MKKVKDKYIRITENELHALIRDEVKKVIPMILEYAIPRNKFVEHVYNLLPQICENWCLIRYSKLLGDNNLNANHWKSELKAHLRNISSIKLKVNNSVNARMSAISQAFDWSDLDDSYRKVYNTIFRKFETENYSSEEKEPLITVCFNFYHEAKKLTILMANSNDNDIDEYVNSL